MMASVTPGSETPDGNESGEQTGAWLSSAVSRRNFFVGAGGAAALAALAACGGGGGSGNASGGGGGSTGTPKRGGDFRLGVTGGGAKDLFDGQNITTKPDQARLVSAFETLLNFRRELPADQRRTRRECHGGQPQAVHDQAP